MMPTSSRFEHESDRRIAGLRRHADTAASAQGTHLPASNSRRGGQLAMEIAPVPLRLRRPSSVGARSSHRLADFLVLMKPRLMALAVFTAVVGLLIAPGDLDPLRGSIAILAIAAGAGAAGVLNMWRDADIDALMSRTAARPIPRGRVAPAEALAFGLVLAAVAVVVLAVAANVTAAALLAFTIFFYVVVYTAWLKRRTPQNIVIGGAAG